MYTRPGSRSAYVQVPTSPYIRVRIRLCTGAVCGVWWSGGRGGGQKDHIASVYGCALSWQDFRGAFWGPTGERGVGAGWGWAWGWGWDLGGTWPTEAACIHPRVEQYIANGWVFGRTELNWAECKLGWGILWPKPQRRYGSWLRRRRQRSCSSSSADPLLEPLAQAQAQVRVQETGAEIHWADVKSKFRPCSFTELPRN